MQNLFFMTFYDRPKQQDADVERIHIIETAANLIKNDIKQ